MEYMRKIFPEGQKHGIIKIIPPESWNPDFVVDTEVIMTALNFLDIFPAIQAVVGMLLPLFTWNQLTLLLALSFQNSQAGAQLRGRRYERLCLVSLTCY